MSDDWFTSMDDLEEIQEKKDREDQDLILRRRAERGIAPSERSLRPDFSHMARDEWLSGDDISDIRDYEDGKALDDIARRQRKRDNKGPGR